MTVYFYSNSSDKRFVNKNLMLVATVEDVVLLDNAVNVVNPHFRVSGISWGLINYCYVPEFGRYYYITNVEMLHGNMSNITCNVDVLMSFKNDILNTSGIVERSAIAPNVLIPDSYNVNRADETLTNLAFSGCEFSSTNTTNDSSIFLLATFGGTTREV